jgi:HlyD family secretion protein
MRTSFRLSGAIVAVGLVTALVVALRPRPVLVEVATVTRGPLTATVTAEGRTRVRDLYVVAAPVDGELERIASEPGDAVTPGTAVVRIWPMAPKPLDVRSRAQAIATVAAARATVARAEASAREAAAALIHAESQLATARTLSREGAAASKDAEHAGHETQIRRDAVDAAEAAVQAARAEMERADALVASGALRAERPATVVFAPVAGRVLRVLRESAGPVLAGTPLVEIGSADTIEVVSDLLTADAMTVKPAATAVVREWGGADPITASVRRIDPAAFTKVSALGLEEQRVRVVLDLVRPLPPGLGHDFRVSVSIAVWHGQNVLQIPSTALFRSGDQWAVFAVRDGRVRLTSITPGRSDGVATIVSNGLAEGDVVVLQPSDLLSDGVRVQETRRVP